MNQSEPNSSAPLLERIKATFLNPGSLPALVRPGLPWLDVLLISTVVAVLSVAAVPDEFFTEPMEAPVSRRGEPVEVVSSPEVIANWGRALGMLATLGTHPVVAAVIAGAVTLLFVTFFRAPATFRDYLSLTAHVLLIPALGTILSIAARWIFGRPLLPGFTTISGEPRGALEAGLLAIDPFVIWMMIALAFAAHTLDPRRSRLQAALLLVGGYLVLVFASTALVNPTG